MERPQSSSGLSSASCRASGADRTACAIGFLILHIHRAGLPGLGADRNLTVTPSGCTSQLHDTRWFMDAALGLGGRVHVLWWACNLITVGHLLDHVVELDSIPLLLGISLSGRPVAALQHCSIEAGLQAGEGDEPCPRRRVGRRSLARRTRTPVLLYYGGAPHTL